MQQFVCRNFFVVKLLNQTSQTRDQTYSDDSPYSVCTLIVDTGYVQLYSSQTFYFLPQFALFAYTLLTASTKHHTTDNFSSNKYLFSQTKWQQPCSQSFNDFKQTQSKTIAPLKDPSLCGNICEKFSCRWRTVVVQENPSIFYCLE